MNFFFIKEQQQFPLKLLSYVFVSFSRVTFFLDHSKWSSPISNNNNNNNNIKEMIQMIHKCMFLINNLVTKLAIYPACAFFLQFICVFK